MTWGPLVVLAGVFLLGFVAFTIRTAIRGLVRTERVEQLGGSVVLGKFLLEYGYWTFSPVARTAIRLRIHPDVFTWTSLVFQISAGLLLADGAFSLGGWAIVFGASCDALDGLVARGLGIASRAGEVLDAVVDRLAEVTVFLGLAWYYRTVWWAYVIVAAGCAGSVMVSYTRALGEARGIDAKMGLMQRHERAAWLATSAIVSGAWELWHPTSGFALHSPVVLAVGAIAVLATWTGLRRALFVRDRLRRDAEVPVQEKSS